MGKLDGKVALITGGARGQGRSHALRLAGEGADIVTVDICRQIASVPYPMASSEDLAETVREVEALDRRIVAREADVRDSSALADVVAQGLAEFGHIDILVANAGISGRNDTLWQYPVDEWKQVIDVNLNGTFHCCRAVVPGMIEQNYGRIVTVASIAGKEGNPKAAAYSASKAGVIALTKSLGKELAEYDISVNCITPAAAKTAILEQCTPAHIDYMLSKIPRNRFLLVDEVAAMVAWLVSSENSFTTGAVFDLSGGRATY